MTPLGSVDSAALEAREPEQAAASLMMRFAERTGLTSRSAGRRYLWTDAFAVCNFLGLARATGAANYARLALELVDRVHHTLGRHRPDDPRTGWISGLASEEGEQHPVQGGLRIGKELRERGPREAFDERLEWERDGQYFHYLTKWMHALDQMTRSNGTPVFNLWARELAVSAHRAFVYFSGSERRMYWKMSIDLSRPLIPSMGQHDPLDGYLTYAELEATRASVPPAAAVPGLDAQAASFASMIEVGALVTADPLAIGGLLFDAFRLDRLVRGKFLPDEGLGEALLGAAAAGVRVYAQRGELDRRAEQRLAFRELGLAIGFSALEQLQSAVGAPLVAGRSSLSRVFFTALRGLAPLREKIVGFWLDPAHRHVEAWQEHQDINEMLATALAPKGLLGLAPRCRSEP